jgi:hypothetical protein
MFIPPFARLRMSLHHFVEWNTVTKVDMTTIKSIVPRLINVIHNDVNLRALLSLHVYHITTFNHIAKESGQRNKKPEAMLFHACIVGVVELHTHADQLFLIHALAGLVNAGAILTVSPDGTDDLGSMRHVLAFESNAVHPLRIILVKLRVLGFNPLEMFRALEASPASMTLTISHVGCFCGGDKHDGVWEIPAVKDMVNTTKLVESHLGQMGLLVGGIWAIWGHCQCEGGIHRNIQNRQSKLDLVNRENRNGVHL